MKRLPFYQVDAFASALFRGNPAGIVLLAGGDELSDSVMQSIAAENNLAETAFVEAMTGGHGGTPGEPALYRIRWFTPTTEVDLCGHATLAAAHVLFERGAVEADEISFDSRSGKLSVARRDERLVLDFPADHAQPVDPPPELVGGLGVMPRETFRGKDDLVAVLDSREAVEGLRPDMSVLARLECRGVIVTALGSEVDFVSRFFAPQSGIPEDPVTGSAHTTLAPFWGQRLDRHKLTARQLSARGGELACEVRGDRVAIAGCCVTYLRGEIFVT